MKRTQTVAASRRGGWKHASWQKSPEMEAEIEKWEERLTPLEDLKKCKARLLGNIENLAFHAHNEHVRLAASRTLVEYCEKHEGREG
jgi:hypothetical protein